MAGLISAIRQNRYRELSNRLNNAEALPGHNHAPEAPVLLQECGAKFLRWLRDSGRQSTLFEMMLFRPSSYADPSLKLRNLRQACPDLCFDTTDDDDFEIVFGEESIFLWLKFVGCYQRDTPRVVLHAIAYLKVDTVTGKFTKVDLRFEEEECRRQLSHRR